MLPRPHGAPPPPLPPGPHAFALWAGFFIALPQCTG